MQQITYFGAIGLTLLAATTPVQAQNTISFVSALNGRIGDPCTSAAPCRTLAEAISKTNAGGEINALGPGNLGPVMITKAISIVSRPGEGEILVPSGQTGITINADPNAVITLSGITIQGAGVGLTGVLFNTGQSLIIERCVIRNVTGDGIDFFPAASANLTIADTFVANAGVHGIEVLPSGSGTVTATFNRVEVDDSGYGILVQGTSSTGTISATATDGVAAGNNPGPGFYAASAGAPTSLMVFRSVAANNVTGVEAQGAGATLRLSQSVVTGNVSGWTAPNAAVLSYGDNRIDGNASNNTSPPIVPTK